MCAELWAQECAETFPYKSMVTAPSFHTISAYKRVLIGTLSFQKEETYNGSGTGWFAYKNEAGCSQEEGPKKGFVMGSRTQGVQEILEKCM